MDPMAGADLDVSRIPVEVHHLRLRNSLDSLGLICRTCNCRPSNKCNAEVHARGDSHEEVVDVRTHHAKMMPFMLCSVTGGQRQEK